MSNRRRAALPDRRRVVLGLTCAFFLLVVAVAPAAAGAQAAPDEDAVVVRVDPGTADRVTVYLPQDEYDEPERAVRERAAEAGLPVHDVRTATASDRVTVYVNGRVVDGGQTYWRVTLATSLDEDGGVFQRQLPTAALGTLADSRDADVTLESYPGTTVVGQGVEPEGGLVVQRHRVDATGDVAYGLWPGDVALLLGWLAASFLLPYAAYREYARRVRRADVDAARAVYRLDSAYAIGAAIGLAVCVAVGAALGARTLVGHLAGAVLPVAITGEWWSTTLLALAIAPFGAAAVLGPIAATHPHVRELREIEQPLRARLREESRALALVAVQLWLVVVLVATLGDWSTHPVVGAALLGGLVACKAVLAPALVRLFGDVEPADDRTRAAVERTWRAGDDAPPTVHRLDTGGSAVANATLAGILPGRRHLFLTDRLLECLDGPQLRAILAHEHGHATNRHLRARLGLAVGCGVVGFAALGLLPLSNATTFLIVVFGYLQVAGRYSLRQEYEADAHAADVTDPETVVAALERLAAVNVTAREVSAAYERATYHPSTAERVAALREDVADDDVNGDGERGDRANGDRERGDASDDREHVGDGDERTGDDATVDGTTGDHASIDGMTGSDETTD